MKIRDYQTLHKETTMIELKYCWKWR